ncbi:MAG: DUF59 domain-containing protein, partial [Candidatus Rokubacteria bacterium]|nr:DUF59 domain-containing protein [Candidatus Rokubacteria bacterium]
MAISGDKSTVTEEAVLTALRAIQDPEARKDVVSLGMVKDLAIQGGRVTFTLQFTTQPAMTKVELHSQARRAVAGLPGVSDVKVAMGSAQAAAAGRPAHASAESVIPQVKHTIAVSSGKGGVGKS